MSRPPSPPAPARRPGLAVLALGALVASSLTLTAPPAQAADTLLSQGRTATASSFQQSYGDCPCEPAEATDGRAGTRWASDWSDPQWIRVGLGAPTAIRKLQLQWDPACAKSYEVRVSDDGSTWRTVHSTTTGNGDIDTIDVTATARHVRLHLTARGTGWGCSLHEFGVYS